MVDEVARPRKSPVPRNLTEGVRLMEGRLGENEE